MHFDNTLLSAGDKAALTAAQAAVPAVLTPLSNAITSAQATGAAALSLSAALVTLETQRQTLLSGGSVSPQGPEIAAIVAQKTTAATNLLTAEQALGPTRDKLLGLCQACGPVLGALLPIAQRQAATQITTAFAPFFRANSNALQTAPTGTDFLPALTVSFRVPAVGFSSVAEAVAAATAIQTLLQNIGAGTDFFTLN